MSQEEAEYNYCPSCGANLPDGVKFCPDCGTQLDKINDSLSGEVFKTRLIIVSVFCLIYALGALLTGVSLAGSADQIVIAMEDSPDWSEIVKAFEDMGYNEAQVSDLFLSIFVGMGAMLIISGIAAAVTAVCGFTKKYWVVGLIAIILAVITSSATILGLIVGIIFTYLYVTCKPAFVR